MNLYNIYIYDGWESDDCSILAHKTKYSEEELQQIIQKALIKLKDVNGFNLMSELQDVLINDYNFEVADYTSLNIINLI